MGFDDVDDLVEVVFEGHGAWIGGLLAAHELGLDVRWGEFDDFDVGRFELVAKGFAPGVDGGLGRAVGGGEGQRDEGEAGRDRHDGSVGLLLEVRQQRGGEADGAEEVGGDDSLGVGCVGFVRKFSGRMMPALWMTTLRAGKSAVSFSAKERMLAASSMFRATEVMPGLAAVVSSRTCLRRPAMMTLLPSLVEGLCEAAADAGAAAGDEYGVAGGFHGRSFSSVRI